MVKRGRGVLGVNVRYDEYSNVESIYVERQC